MDHLDIYQCDHNNHHFNKWIVLPIFIHLSHLYHFSIVKISVKLTDSYDDIVLRIINFSTDLLQHNLIIQGSPDTSCGQDNNGVVTTNWIFVSFFY